MNRTRNTLLLSLLILAVAPLRPAAGSPADVTEAVVVVVAAPASELALLARSMERSGDRSYTVRLAGFTDPDGRMAERAASELRAAGLEVGISRIERGAMVSRLYVGRASRYDARRLADALRRHYDWPAYVTRAP